MLDAHTPDERRPLRSVDATDDPRQEFERILTFASEAARMTVWRWNLELDTVTWGAVFAESQAHAVIERGSGLSELIGAVHPDDRLYVEQSLRDAVATKTDVEVRFRVPMVDGADTWMMLRGRANDRADAPDEMVGVVIDITEQVRTRQRVERILATIDDGYFTLDCDDRFTYANERCLTSWGRTADELIGKSVADVFAEIRGTEYPELFARARSTGEPVEVETSSPSGRTRLEMRIYPDGDDLTVYFRDVTQRWHAERDRERLLLSERAAREEAERAKTSLAYAASHDRLTGLPNRDEFMRQLRTHVVDGTAVMFVDLDRFKVVNDSYGHRLGDRLLVGVAQRLRGLITPPNVVARVGGDEFVVSVPGLPPERALAFAERIVAVLQQPMVVGGVELVGSASVGVATGEPGTAPEVLLRDADTALYHAKRNGRNCAAMFDQAMRDRLLTRLGVERGIAAAIERSEFRLAYQPIFSADALEVVGHEALLRWQRPNHGLTLPADFVPIAEQAGSIVAIGRWVIDDAVRRAPNERGVTWINASRRQICDYEPFSAVVKSALDRHGVDPSRIGIEVTETALLEDEELASRELRELERAGVQIALDDFGVGYSSLTYLQRWRPSIVKIDRSFVAHAQDERSRALLAAAIDLVHAVGADVTAEGIETSEQLGMVRDLGCTYVSGTLLGTPQIRDD